MTATQTRGVGTDTSVVKSSWYLSMGDLSDPGGVTTGYLQIWPANPYANPTVVNSIATAYEFFRVRALSIEFCPTAGSTQSGLLHTCFINNPAVQAKMANSATTTSERADIVRNTQNARIVGAVTPMIQQWQMGARPTSRNWYNCSPVSNNPTTTEVDDSCPATFAWYATGPPGDVLGAFRINVTYEFRSLGNAQAGVNFTHQLAAGMDPLLIPYNLIEGGPKTVVLRSPGIADAVYVPKEPPSKPSDQA